MCDSLCAVGHARTLFAKNSDRRPDEAQVLEVLPRRASGGTLRTQHLEIDDLGAAAILASRPAWLWGLEHGVNEHRVAIGNEQEWTTDRGDASMPGLLGMDFDAWRDPSVKTLHADRRLAASRKCLAGRPTDELSVAHIAAHLRDHDGDGPPPQSFEPFGEGVTVCMHLGRHQATTASMIAELPTDPALPVRVWAALGSPCVSIFVPCLAPGVVPGEMARSGTWARFAGLARATEGDPEGWSAAVGPLRAVEAELWEEADALGTDEGAWRRFVDGAWERVDSALGAAAKVSA